MNLLPFYPWMHLAGRLLVGITLVVMGGNHLAAFAGVKRVPSIEGASTAGPAVALSGGMMLVGGLLLALGWHRFIGAGLVVVFCPLAGLLTHAPWRQTDPILRQNAQAHLLKNFALAGAALFMAVYAGTWWPMSLGG